MSTRFIDHLLVGVIGDRPSATAVPVGTLYAASDEQMVYQSDGTNWDDWLDATGGGGTWIPATLLDAKGDLIAASAADTAARLAVGTDGHVLTADSSQSLGVKWAAAAGGGGGGAGPTIPRVRTGSTADRFYPAGVITAAGLTTTVVAANEIRALPFVTPHAITVDLLACQITANAAGNLRLGIYADDGNAYPGALLVDGGSISTNTAAVVTATVSQALSAATLYWFVFFCSTASIQVRAAAVSQLAPIAGLASSGFNFPAVGWAAALTFAALPNPYPASASALNAGPLELVFFRAA